MVIFTDNGGDILYACLRIAGLLGFISLSCAVIMNLFKPNLQKILGHPFLPVHHLFAGSGLILITLHPFLYIVLTSDLSGVIPDTSSIYFFFVNGGRVAIIFLYIAFLAGMLRSSFYSRWKPIHRLVYPALFLAIIHANLNGSTFHNPFIWILCNGLAVTIFITWMVKVSRRSQNKNNRISV